jgi:hypothetical protein
VAKIRLAKVVFGHARPLGRGALVGGEALFWRVQVLFRALILEKRLGGIDFAVFHAVFVLWKGETIPKTIGLNPRDIRLSFISAVRDVTVPTA